MADVINFDELFYSHNYSKFQISDNECVYIVEELTIIYFKTHYHLPETFNYLMIDVYELTPNNKVVFDSNKIKEVVSLQAKNDIFVKINDFKYNPETKSIDNYLSTVLNIDFDKIYDSYRTKFYFIIVNLNDNYFRISFVENYSEIESRLKSIIKRMEYDIVLDYRIDKNYSYYIYEYDAIDAYELRSKKAELLDKLNNKKIDLSFIPKTIKSNKPILVSQSRLANRIRKIFPDENISFEHTPFFKNGPDNIRFRYDIYIPAFRVAIEYQGIQHYKPIDYFGGEKALKETQKRDEYKRKISEENDISIIYIDFDYKYTDEDLKKIILEESKNRKIKIGFSTEYTELYEDTFYKEFIPHKTSLMNYISTESRLQNLRLKYIMPYKEFSTIRDEYLDGINVYEVVSGNDFENLIFMYFMDNRNIWYKGTEPYRKYPEIFYYCIREVFINYKYEIKYLCASSISNDPYEHRWMLMLPDDRKKLTYIIDDAYSICSKKIERFKRER